MSTEKEVLAATIRQREVTTVDLRFMDFPGVWQHFAIPADALTEETFEEGIGFDGSSVVGWRAINEADLLVVPQSETAARSTRSTYAGKHDDGLQHPGPDHPAGLHPRPEEYRP